MNLIRATLLGGLVAGALDIIYACVHSAIVYGTPAIRVFQSVAAGLLGPDAARAGGWGSGALGLGLHFMMATMMAWCFVFAASRFAPTACAARGSQAPFTVSGYFL